MPVSEDKEQLLGAIQDLDKLAIFDTDLVKDLIDYKW